MNYANATVSMSFQSLLAPRLDRVNRLYDSCVQVLKDAYTQYETTKSLRDDMVAMCEPTNEEAKILYHDTLNRVLKTFADVEKNVQRCMANLQEVTEFKAFLESLVEVEA